MSFNYLRSFQRLLEKTEVPPTFAHWCGVASLLAMLERRVWIPQGIYNIYPNFFIILVAASGQKKSTPINLVEKLIRRVSDSGPNIVAQKISPEALIGAIKKRVSQDPKKLMVEKCGGIVIADELVTFLDRGALDRGLGPILTKLFDCSPFEYETLKRGTETIKDGYLSLLGGTTVELLRSSLPKDSIGGGFTSRTIFIYEDKIAPPIPWIDFDAELKSLEIELVAHLQSLTKLEGPIEVTPDAREFFEADYRARYVSGGFRTHAGLGAYENRRQSHLFKVAMAIMMAEEPGMVIHKHHLLGAKVLLEDAEEKMPHVIDLIISTDTGAQSNQVYQFIKSHKSVSRSELVRHFSNRLDAAEITKVIDTLVQGQKIKMGTDGKGLRYQYVES